MKFDKESVKESRPGNFFKKFWIPILAVIVVVAVVLSSVDIYQEEVLHIDPSVEYVNGDKLYFASSAIDTLNPIISDSEDTYYIAKLIYNSLFDYTDDFNVEEELVESYEVNTDRARIDITLKSGVKWHDGSELTASDVRFTVNAIKAYGSKGLYYEKANKIYSVNVTGEHTLNIYFRNNTDAALDNLVFPILPKEGYSSTGSIIRDRENFVPVGSGQYMFSSYDYLEKLELVPNESYFANRATLPVSIVILPEKELAASMMEIHAVTCYTDDSTERHSLASDKGFKLYDMISNDAEFLVFNTKKGPFKAKEARQAVAYAIDRENVLSRGYMGDAVPTDTIYYPNFCGVSDTGSGYAYDPEQAASLLAKAGFADHDLDGRLEDAEDENVAITLLVNSNDSLRAAACKLIAKNLTEIGFTVEVKSLAWDEYTEAIEEQEFDILMAGYDMEASFDLAELYNGKALWEYRSNKLLAQAAELEKLHTAAEYSSIYKELKEMLLDELPYYALCYRKMGLVGVENFTAGRLPTFDDVFRNADTWSWKIVKEE